MKSIDPNRLDLVEEFHTNPSGPHGTDLVQLLKIMQWDSPSNRYLMVVDDSTGKLLIAKQQGKRGHALLAVKDEVYVDLGLAQCAVFRKRWSAATGFGLIQTDGVWDTCELMPEETTEIAEVSRPVLGYADQFSARPGERINFKVSSDKDYTASLVKLRCAAPGNILEEHIDAPFDGGYVGQWQELEAGSYIEIPNSEDWSVSSFTVMCYIWPTLLGKSRQAIAGAWHEGDNEGFQLGLNEKGAASLVIGDGNERHEIFAEQAMTERHWYLLAASYNADGGVMQLLQRPVKLFGHFDAVENIRSNATKFKPCHRDFRIAAWHETQLGRDVAGGSA